MKQQLHVCKEKQVFSVNFYVIILQVFAVI